MSRELQIPALLIVITSILFPATGVSAAQSSAQTAALWETQQIRLTAVGEHAWWEYPVTVGFKHQATGKCL